MVDPRAHVRTLFNDTMLANWLGAKLADFTKEIAQWDPDAMLATTDGDISAQLAERYSVQCPELADRSEIAHGSTSEHTIPLGSEYDQRDVRRKVIVRTFHVPFTGDGAVLVCCPSQRSNNPPSGHVDTRTSTLTVVVQYGAGDYPSPETIRAQVMQQLDTIQAWLSWARQQIEAYNSAVADPAPIRARRAEILAEHDLQAAIGFKVQRRDDADRFSVPIQRRRIAPQKPAATSKFEPEPEMAERDYEAAMDVLTTARNALERTPSLATTYGEEQIRDLLLIFLNAHFEGAAAGEVYNKNGKTDILIRVRDKNVFIAECKIWNGPKTVDEGLEQLLDRYLTWRDAKAALLLFIRSANATDITGKTTAAITAHPRYKRTIRTGSPGERSDYILGSKDDAAHEIKLAVLPFILPKA